jgi:hypothetical protein
MHPSLCIQDHMPPESCIVVLVKRTDLILAMHPPLHIQDPVCSNGPVYFIVQPDGTCTFKTSNTFLYKFFKYNNM